MISRENITFGASLLRELGLWGGAVVSGAIGFAWSTPWVIVAFAGGRGHTSDWIENALVFCAAIAALCFLAMTLFIIGAIRNTVGTGSNKTAIVIEDHNDTERL